MFKKYDLAVILTLLVLVICSLVVACIIRNYGIPETVLAEAIASIEVIEVAKPYIEPQLEYYDIPLSYELQEYTQTVCQQYNVPLELALAVMAKESSYQVDAVNGKSYGLMQIHEINFSRLSDKLSITDFNNPQNNILAGVYMLSELTAKYDDLHKVLMAYNHGEAGAKKLWREAIYSTDYSNKVLDTYKLLKQEVE